MLKPTASWPLFCPFVVGASVLSLSLSLASCQAPATRLESPQAHIAQEIEHAAAAAFPKTPTGRVQLQNQTLSLSVQLPPLPGFRTQRLDLTTAQQLRARVSDFYGHSYRPEGADRNGLIAYPSDGVLQLNFKQVVSAPLIFVTLEVLENGQPVPQAELGTVFASTTGVPFPGVDFNFQTSAVARTLKTLHSSQPERARAVDLTALENLMRTLTGVSGTAPTLSYTTHPSLVNSDLLASHLLTRQPSELTPADYRRSGAAIALTVTGLIGTDQLQAQVTDAATAPVSELGNGTHTVLGVTPGGPLQVKGSDAGTPVMSYTYSATPASFVASDGQSQAVTLTATPTFTVTSTLPQAARTGATVVLNGTNLTGTTAVRFNGVNASFTVDSPTQISAVVPATATDGPISVVNRGTWTTPSFDVYRTWYVNNGAAGAQNGLSWATPYHDLQAALSSSGAYDEIWIASGTYKPAAASGNTDSSFQMKEHVALYGGFGGSELLRSERDPATRLVTLSGDLNSNDDYTVEPFANLSDNSLRVIRGADNAILDGVTVQGGGQGTAAGAGMYNQYVSPTVTNVVFRNNTGSTGGGMYNTGQLVAGVPRPVMPTLTNVRFIDNRATADGAGLYNNLVADSVQTNLSFSGNHAAGAGGGIYNNRVSTTTFNNLTLTQNRSDTTGIISSGGGMANGQSIFTINGGSFSQNQGAGCGGGLSVVDLSQVTLNDVSFSGNSAVRGGGLCATTLDARVQLNRVTFSSNTASNQGGGIMFNTLSAGNQLSDVTLSGNSAGNQGGGIMMNGASTATLSDVTLSDNTSASQGGGILMAGASTATLSDVAFNNNTATSQGGGMMVSAASTATLDQVSFTGNSVNGPNAPGGGIAVNGSTATLTRSRLIGNTAAGTGTHNGLGLQAVNAATVTLSNVLFANHVVTSGSSTGGGLFCNNNSTVQLSNATFANNQATTGGGGIHIVSGGVLNMQNALFWQSSQFGATVGSQGNFSVTTDPFVSSATPASNGLRLAPTATDLIDMGITGTGVPLTDILGNARINAPEPGAYEFSL